MKAELRRWRRCNRVTVWLRLETKKGIRDGDQEGKREKKGESYIQNPTPARSHLRGERWIRWGKCEKKVASLHFPDISNCRPYRILWLPWDKDQTKSIKIQNLLRLQYKEGHLGMDNNKSQNPMSTVPFYSREMCHRFISDTKALPLSCLGSAQATSNLKDLEFSKLA